MEFTNLTFWRNPIPTLCFFSLGMSIASLWIKKNAWLWGSFLASAILLALEASILTPLGLIPIAILFFCHYFLKRDLNKGVRYLTFGVALTVSVGLFFHFLPGFHNWRIAANMTLSPQAVPYHLWLNFDKPFIGLFVLVFRQPLIAHAARLKAVLVRTLPIILVSILGMALLSWYWGLVGWAPKLPAILVPWMLCNLFFVTIPEEAFFRGFLQREIYEWFGKTKGASLLAVIVTSLFFTLLHVNFAPSFSFLGLIFLASMIYGALYQTTKAIESSILCHFLFNLTHFLLLSYPALQI